MPNTISAYLSSADTTINLGTDTVLLLNNPVTTPIVCDFTSVIRIPKNDLQGISYQLNPETFAGGTNYVDANEDDITISVIPEAQATNALSNLLNTGTLIVDRNSRISPRINSVIAYKDDLKTEEVMTLDIVHHVYGDYRLISYFANENSVKEKIKETLNRGIRDQNLVNVASTSYNDNNGISIPIKFKWKRDQNQMIDNAMDIFDKIANAESERLLSFTSSNNYTQSLSELLRYGDTLSFVVTYTQNQNQKTFYNSDPSPRDPTRLCITIIVTE